MLDKRRNPHKTKIAYTKPTEQADEIAKLKIEKEILERGNREGADALEKKRKSLNLDYKACEKIEKEHFDKVDKLNNKYVKLLADFDYKNKEYNNLNSIIGSLNNFKQELLQMIPGLESKKSNLEKEIYETTEKFNTDKKNSEIYLTGIREKIDKENKVYFELEQKLIQAKEELRLILEKHNEENKVLGRRQKDLEIYEFRLRKKYPNDTIILS